MESESQRLRLSILGVVMLSLFGALFARLWYLQVMTATQFEQQTTSNAVRTVYTEAPRGRILDRWGKVIVDNRTSLVVTVNPHELDLTNRRPEVLLRLATELTRAGVPTKVSMLEDRLNDKQFNPLQPIPVAIDVPEALEITLKERSEEFPSIDVKRESVRNYPNQPSTIAAHVVGYTGRVSEEELKDAQGTEGAPKTIPKPYQPDSEIGKTGVERVYESKLRGTPGVCKLEVDAKNKPVRTTECTPPVPGDDLVLTIDLELQKNLETNLALQLFAARGSPPKDGVPVRAPAGSAVALNPQNGQILAMASYPTYDPAEFVNGISAARFKQISSGGGSDNPLINRAIAGQYAPGSTFKLVTATAALNQGLINGSTVIVDGGSFKFGELTFKNAGGASNGPVSMAKALTVSSDVFFYTLGGQYWRERDRWGSGIQQQAALYGFNAPTGVPLPGEAGGFVLTPESKKKLNEDNPEAFPYGTWNPGDTVQLAIGQNVVVATPIQMANAYATFSQRGTRYKPQILAKTVKPGTTNVFDPANDVEIVQPEVAQQIPIPENVFGPIFTGLSGVPEKALGGTAGEAFAGWDLKAWPIAGKTGTAQVDDKADTSWFVAYGPAPAPQVVAVAVLEESGFGAEAAAPVVRKLLEPIAGQVPPPPFPVFPPGTDLSALVPSQGQPGAAPATVPTTAAGRRPTR
ncbi:MAG: penicillin-binding protein 2 [Actinobacteria bacterium]|nr:penicillin-binding protein 2 [Actinomycetota bacterium]